MQNEAKAVKKTKTSLRHRLMACVVSALLVLSCTGIAYAFDEQVSDAAAATEEEATSDTSAEESTSSGEEATGTGESEETATSDSEIDEASTSESTSDATSDEVSSDVSLTLPALSSAISPLAASTVEYLDTDGTTQSVSATVVESNTGTVTWSDSWYVVSSNVTISGRITVSGTVNLILVDGYTLDAQAGITVDGTNSLTIYGQTEGTGTLNATATSSGYAGIGGTASSSSATSSGPITINGGTVNATGLDGGAGIGGGGINTSSLAVYTAGDGSYITINGGTVTAIGGSIAVATTTGTYYGGAGIGGGAGGFGNSSSAGNGSYIYINGGTVTATGGGTPGQLGGGAGIGGGALGGGIRMGTSGTNLYCTGGDGSYINIAGGTVVATGGGSAAGIGGGGAVSTATNLSISEYGNGTNIVISGGTVTATGGSSSSMLYAGAGIGGGYSGYGTVTISGGTVTANSTTAAGIGSGYYPTTTVNSTAVTITGGAVIASASYSGAQAIGNGRNSNSVTRTTTINYANGYWYRTTAGGTLTQGTGNRTTGTYIELYPAYPSSETDAASVSFNPDSKTIYVNETLDLTQYLSVITPDGYSVYGSYVWTSDDSTIASVDTNGTVTGHVVDTTTITVTVYMRIDGLESTEVSASATFTVTVIERPGSLTISKTVAGDDPDTDQGFTFEVSLGDTSVSSTFSVSHTGNSSMTSISFSEGKATVTLKHNESITISGLPAGSYTVTEDVSTDDWTTSVAVDGSDQGTTTSATGTISTDATSTVAFTNTAVEAVSTFSLVIYKYTSTTDTQGGSSETPLEGAVFRISTVNAVNPDTGEVTSSTRVGSDLTTNENGEATATELELEQVYMLEEITTPSGYTLASARYIKVVEESGTLVAYLTDASGNPKTDSDTDNSITLEAVTGSANTFKISIENTQMPSMPQTGFSGALLVFMTGGAIVAAGLYVLCGKKSKFSRAAHTPRL